MKLLKRPGDEVVPPGGSYAFHHFDLLLTLSVAAYLDLDGQVATAPYGVYVSGAGLRLCGDAFGILTVHRAEHAAMRDAPGCDDSALGRDTGSPSAAKVDIANDRFSQAVAGAGVELRGNSVGIGERWGFGAFVCQLKVNEVLQCG